MKNFIKIATLAVLSCIIFSCKKTGVDTGISVNAVAPTITTNDASNIVSTNATVGGNVSTDGGSILTEVGICYSTMTGVDTSKNKTPYYTGGGKYNIILKNLSLLTTYYYKAYAINSKGITYGAEKSFFVPVNGYSSSSQVAAANLKAYWGFENSYIDSVSSTVGTANHASSISFVTGIKGKAVQVAVPVISIQISPVQLPIWVPLLLHAG